MEYNFKWNLPFLSRGLNLSHGSNSLNSASGNILTDLMCRWHVEDYMSAGYTTGTVCVMSSYLLFKEGPPRFTTVPLNLGLILCWVKSRKTEVYNMNSMSNTVFNNSDVNCYSLPLLESKIFLKYLTAF